LLERARRHTASICLIDESDLPRIHLVSSDFNPHVSAVGRSIHCGAASSGRVLPEAFPPV
jgi:hypothetical protein